MVGTKVWKAIRLQLAGLRREMKKLDCATRCTIQHLDNGRYRVTIEVNERQSSVETDSISS